MNLNIDAWKKLLARLELPATRLQWAMDSFGDCEAECATVGCLALHAVLANDPLQYVSKFLPVTAGRLLGLNSDAQDFVFFGQWAQDESSFRPSLCDITLETAIAYVKAVIETGDYRQAVIQQ